MGNKIMGNNVMLNRLNSLPFTTETIVELLLILIVSYAVYRIILQMVRQVKKRYSVSDSLILTVEKILRYFLFIVILIQILSVFGIDVSSLIMSLGIISLALTLAAKDTLSNLISGIIIVLEKRFETGDMIEVGGYNGQVKKIGIRSVELIHKKRLIVIPNQYFTTKPFINYTRQGFYGIYFDVMVLNKYNLDEKLDEIEEILAKSDLILKDPPHLIKVKNVKTTGVDVTVKVYIDNPNDDVKVITQLIKEIKRNVVLEDIS